MPDKSPMVPERETAHVLFMDLVGFSKLPAPEQKRIAEVLRDLLRDTEEFKSATAQGTLACLPSGDGAAVLFFTSATAPVRCALQLQQAARNRPEMRFRLGIHSGTVERTTDINGNLNFVGPGMNLAQRVMDCGDAGHILLSGATAQALADFNEYASALHELGSTTVKHQQRVALFSLHGDGFGNPQVPERLLLSSDPNRPPGAPLPIPQEPSGTAILLLQAGVDAEESDLVAVLETRWRAAGARLLPQPSRAPRMTWAERLIQCIHEAQALVFVHRGQGAPSEVFEATLAVARDARRRRGVAPKVFAIELPGNASPEIPTAPAAWSTAALWDGHWLLHKAADAPTIADSILEATSKDSPAPIRSVPADAGPTVGPVPLASPHYVLRPSDDDFATALDRRDTVILVKGARQMGKTSLLSRGLQQVRSDDARLVFTDFQKWHDTDLASTEAFFFSLAESFAFDLRIETPPGARWNPARAPGINFERYLVREVLAASPRPFVWAMDEVDRLLDFGFSSEVFGLFRSWYGARQMDPEGPWSRLMLVIAYATEAHYFIRDPNQSPFNVGTTIRLRDFTPIEVAHLNQRLGAPLRSEAEIARFHRLVGGQPFLVRSGLNEMVSRGMDVAKFEKAALRDDGPFNDHLQHLLFRLARASDLLTVVKSILRGERCPTVESFFQLRTAGILAGDSPLDARLRCELYHAYLDRHLR